MFLHCQACGRFLPHHVDRGGSDLQRSRNRQTRGGEDSRSFVNQLCRSYETAQTRHNNERSRLQKAMAELNLNFLPPSTRPFVSERHGSEPKRPSGSRTWSTSERTTSSQKVRTWASHPVFPRWRLRVSRRSHLMERLFLRLPRRARKGFSLRVQPSLMQ